jgi:hypothetical protein
MEIEITGARRERKQHQRVKSRMRKEGTIRRQVTPAKKRKQYSEKMRIFHKDMNFLKIRPA